MEIENKITGGEYDFCLVCGNCGDNTNLYKIKYSFKYICFECKEKYENAKQLIKEYDKKTEIILNKTRGL